MDKYTLIPEQLLYEGSISQANLFDPKPMAVADILTTHKADYWEKLSKKGLTPKEARKTGFPYSKELVDREITIMQGSLDCARYAMEHGVSLNVAGGTHHAYTDHGEGFCLLNDFGIAANCLLASGEVSNVLIVDLDVHQGNGTAEIMQNESRVFTFSMHCEANYPMHKEQSDLDIALPMGTKDEAFLQILSATLPDLLDQLKPDIVMYLSGVDIVSTDKLGKMACTKAGCYERDRRVFAACRKRDIPVVVALGGGYSPQIRDIVEAHCNTFRLAKELWF